MANNIIKLITKCHTKMEILNDLPAFKVELKLKKLTILIIIQYSNNLISKR